MKAAAVISTTAFEHLCLLISQRFHYVDENFRNDQRSRAAGCLGWGREGTAGLAKGKGQKVF